MNFNERAISAADHRSMALNIEPLLELSAIPLILPT